MINIKLNEKTITLEKPISLQEILQKENLTESFFAVAINRKFIPRSRYITTTINHNDHIEIITAMQGG